MRHMPQLRMHLQAAHMLRTVERLRARQYKFFGAPPSPDAVFRTPGGVRAYNRIIPLPRGLDIIEVCLGLRVSRSRVEARNIH